MEGYAVCFLFIGVIVVVLNMIVIYCIKKKFHRENNSQLVLLSSLSIADLFQGIDVLCIASLSTLIRFRYKGKSIPPVIMIVHGILVDFLSKYIFSVSVVTLMALTIVKMFAVKRNQYFTSSSLRKVSVSIWVVNFVLLSAEYAVYKAGIYTPSQKE